MFNRKGSSPINPKLILNISDQNENKFILMTS